MNFDPLSFTIGKHGDSGPVRDVVSYLIGRVSGTAGEIWQTLTNVSVASFTAVSATLRDLVVDVTPVQSGSGDPSPTNVRPISGWTGANVTRTNANMFLKLPVASGQKRSAPIGIVAGTKYTIETTVTGYRTSTNAFVVVYDRNGNELESYTSSGNINLGIDPSHPLTFTAPEGAVYCKFVFFKSGVTTCPFDPTNTYMHTGNPVGDIVAGVNNTYSVALPSEAGTVYGGTLADSGDGTWTLTVTHADIASYAGESINEPWISSMDVYTAGATPTTGAQVVCPLTTPTTYTLTAESVQALIGQNNIFADTGNINTITFRTH